MANSEYAVAAIGDDKPGIVAAVGEALLRVGASIEDSSMTILGGSFAMLLLVRGEFGGEQLDAALSEVAAALDLTISVRPTTQHAARSNQGNYVVAAYGPDQQGLVVALARVLAAHGVNIADFGSRITERGVFAMWFNVAIPSGIVVSALAEELRLAGGEKSLDVTIHEVDGEAL